MTIRPLRDGEPVCDTPMPVVWNPALVWVAEDHGERVGVVAVWDAGHSVIRVDLLDAATPAAMRALYRAVEDYARQHNKVVSFHTDSPQFAHFIEKRGGTITSASFVGWIAPR